MRNVVNHQCNDCQLKGCFINKGCSPQWLFKITEKKTCIKYKSGQQIIHEGSPVFGMYFIYSGKVKVFTSGYNGKEQIVRLAKTGQILGHRGYAREKYPIGAVALEDSWICFVDNDTLSAAFLENSMFTYELMMYYSDELRKSEARNKYMAQMTVYEKIMFALLMLYNHFGFKENSNIVDIPYSRGDVASIAGTNPDQVSRFLAELKKDKIIEVNGKVLKLVNLDKIRTVLKSYVHSFTNE